MKHIIDIVSSARDEWDTETSRSSLPQTCSVNETHSLLAAVGTGKNLRPTPITSPMAGGGAAGGAGNNLTSQQQQQQQQQAATPANKRSQQHQG